MMEALSDGKQSDKRPPEVAVVHAEGLILVGMPSIMHFARKHHFKTRTQHGLYASRAVPTC